MTQERVALLTHAESAQYAHVGEHIVQVQTLLAGLGDTIDAEAEEPMDGNRVKALHHASLRAVEDLAALIEGYYAPRPPADLP